MPPANPAISANAAVVITIADVRRLLVGAAGGGGVTVVVLP
jgi:hypothetical protein